jgi:hypothetical protein
VLGRVLVERVILGDQHRQRLVGAATGAPACCHIEARVP